MFVVTLAVVPEDKRMKNALEEESEMGVSIWLSIVLTSGRCTELLLEIWSSLLLSPRSVVLVVWSDVTFFSFSRLCVVSFALERAVGVCGQRTSIQYL
jgi:hypothetical protein